jgi:FkbM family methyltransferase
MKAIYFPDAPEQFGYLPSVPFILKEIYIDKWYERFLIARKDLTIFDVGAYTGITANYLSDFARVIHAVEPNKENYECLVETVKYNKLDKVKTYKAAITAKDGPVKLFNGGQNSANNILGGAAGFEEVEGWSLDTLFKKTGETHVDLLKIDIEGAEFEVIGGKAFKDNAGKIDLIMGETHTWANRNPNQVYWALRDNGFEVELPKSDAQVYVARRII